MAILYAGKQVVIPPNPHPGTLGALEGEFDAHATREICGPTTALKLIDPRQAIINIYTSGSTGKPKPIRKTLAQFEAELCVLESLWGQGLGQATIIGSVPHFHFYGLLFRLFWPVAAGRVFDAVTCAQPDLLKSRLSLFANTVLISSPALLSRLPELMPLNEIRPLPRRIFSSGGPLPAGAAAAFQGQLGHAPTEVFGSTETGGVAWRRQEKNDQWTPMPGIQIQCEEDGALSIRSPFLIDTRPYRMDDAACLLANGKFQLRGRLDRVVKIEEKRLSLSDMEARLAAHPLVSEVALVALSGRRQRVGAALVLKAEGQQVLAASGKLLLTQTLRRYLSAYFDAVLLPRHWRFIAQLPINERGKLITADVARLFAYPAAPEAGPVWSAHH